MAKPLQYQIIAEARRIIEEPQAWCSGKFAVGKTGRALAVGSQRGVKHCAVSALVLAARRTVGSKKDADRIADGIVSMIAPHGSDANAAQSYIWSINDRQGHAAVLDLFDTALAMY